MKSRVCWVGKPSPSGCDSRPAKCWPVGRKRKAKGESRRKEGTEGAEDTEKSRHRDTKHTEETRRNSFLCVSVSRWLRFSVSSFFLRGDMARKYLIETFGCQMNVHDSERMAGLLEQAGFEPADDAADADVVVINTCSVRERAEEKLYTRLGELRQLAREEDHDPIVAVAGCVAQQEGPAIRKRAPGVVDVILGTQAIRRLPMLIEQARPTSVPGGTRFAPSTPVPLPLIDLSAQDDVTWPLGVTARNDPVKAYVTIIEGCNEFCSFCVVPYTRGHERMRPKADIVAEVREAVATGRREVQLLGQIVNHYEAPDDPRCDFAGLLEAVHAVDGVERIRFASPHPRHVDDRLLAAMARLPRVCRHLHLPVQSGS